MTPVAAWRRRWFVLTPQYLCSFKSQGAVLRRFCMPGHAGDGSKCETLRNHGLSEYRIPSIRQGLVIILHAIVRFWFATLIHGMQIGQSMRAHSRLKRRLAICTWNLSRQCEMAAGLFTIVPNRKKKDMPVFRFRLTSW